jgi:DNA-binding HxlR family transcriptional regulator
MRRVYTSAILTVRHREKQFSHGGVALSVARSLDPGVVYGANRAQPRRPQRSDFALIERVQETLEVLSGKWKAHLLFFMARGIHRHCRLVDCLPGASKKMVTDTLRALERDGLVQRQAFAEVPVRVEYSLTTLGWTITEPLMALSEWSEVHEAEVADARKRYRRSGLDAMATATESHAFRGPLAA